MFDSICVRQTGFGNEPALDLGLLAEALLFYQRPVLIMNRAIFIQLLESLGPDGLLRLARSERLSCAYCNQFTGVSTEDVAGPTKRFFMAIAEMTHTAIDQLATEEFRRVTGKSGRGRRLAEKFLERITDVRLDPSISESATADALKASYASSLLADGLKVMAPSYRVPEGIAFELQPVADGRLKLQTNLDLGDINRPLALWAGSGDHRGALSRLDSEGPRGVRLRRSLRLRDGYQSIHDGSTPN